MKKQTFFNMCFSALMFASFSVAAADELMVYSSKNASYLKPMLDQYSRETGTAVGYVIAPAPMLVSRLVLEGAETKADVLLASGVGNFVNTTAKRLLAPLVSRTLERNVPEHLRAKDDTWFAFSKRARTLIYHTDRVKESDLDGYAGLADAKWRGRVCLRTSQAEYTRTLISTLVAKWGEQRTTEVIKGWVANLALPPLADDDQIIAAIREGQCDVGMVNSYYYARLKREDPQTPLKLFWADQDTDGVHMNITAVGVTAHAKNRAQALDFVEWLTTKEAQVQYAKISMEYPVHPKVYPPREIAKWGRFKEDKTSLDHALRLSGTAQQILTNVGYQ